MPRSRPEAIKPLPFPGESPTVALAMAAADRYGMHPEQPKPARAKPKRRTAVKKKASATKAPRRAKAKAALRPRKARAPSKAKAGRRAG